MTYERDRDLVDVFVLDKLKTIEDAVSWIRGGSVECAETAKHATNKENAAYLRGRAHAFGLAARIIEDVVRRSQ